MAEKEQEAQGDDVTKWDRVSQPGLKDAEETQKNWGRKRFIIMEGFV